MKYEVNTDAALKDCVVGSVPDRGGQSRVTDRRFGAKRLHVIETAKRSVRDENEGEWKAYK